MGVAFKITSAFEFGLGMRLGNSDQYLLCTLRVIMSNFP